MRLITLFGDTKKGFRLDYYGKFGLEKGLKCLSISLDKNPNPSIAEVNRFVRPKVGLNHPLFLLEGSLKQHFENYLNEYLKVTEKNSKSYVCR